MPRYVPSQLQWSAQAQSYVLFIDNQISAQAFTSEWLAQVATFSFHSRSGIHYTVRKQRVQRGGSYWYAYRRLQGRVVKRYLGKTTDLTFTRLEEVAHHLESPPEPHHSDLELDQETASSQSALPVLDAGHPSSPATLPLLFSKLSPPRLHAFLLDRSRLFTLLDAGLECALTLLSSPAGFGKTTLVCQWMAARRARADFPPVAWVSLEAMDNDPLHFWHYLITACQAFHVDLQEVHAALGPLTPQPPFVPTELSTVLIALLNTLTRCPAGGILVLEDYHAITTQKIHETLSFFLDHLPASLHLIVITRSDPPFSLARLRAHNELYEIRTTDLRFSQEEMTTLLHHALPFELAASTIQHLHTQLQGWGAGLHLAKLALQRTTTPAERERALMLFSQNNASLQEYFVSEVLALQPELVQQFVLQTSLLTRLSASLCDIVTEQHDSQTMLTLLERSDLFLEPLAAPTLHQPQASQQWYQYHPLFAEAMRNEARRRFSKDQLYSLSVRASRWYELHGFLHEAIDAALSAQDYERATALIAQFIKEHTMPGEIHEPYTLRRWLEQLPEAMLERNPILCLNYATTLLFQSASWQPDAQTLPRLEKLLHMAEHSFQTGHNLSELGELVAFRALLALRLGDMQAATRYAKQSLDWPGSPQSIWHGLSLCIVAEEWIETGCFQQAHAALLEAQALCEAVKNSYFQRVALLKLAQVCFEQGKSQQATALYRQVLAEARKGGPIYTRCKALVGLAALCYEGNDLEGASQHAQEALTIGQSHHLVYYEVQAILLLTRVQQAQGQAVVAQQQLAAFLDKIPASLPYLYDEIQTAQARLALSIGDSMTVQRWAAGHSPHANFSQAREEELLVIRWLRSQYRLEEALHQIERLLTLTEKVGHTRLMLAAQVEQVLVEAASKRKIEAQHLLHEVLVQAFDGNAMRLFLDAGEQMAHLLRSLLPQLHNQTLQAYIRTLLRAFPASQPFSKQTQATALLEPLSPQEMRVLRLLVQHRSNADIANELLVSVNTVRTQVQSIYSKLGVHTRSAASEVARELRLIS